VCVRVCARACVYFCCSERYRLFLFVCAACRLHIVYHGCTQGRYDSARWDIIQESRTVARKPRDAAAVRFGLKFVDNNHYKFKSSQASNARLQSSKRTGAKQFNAMAIQGHSRSHVLESVERR